MDWLGSIISGFFMLFVTMGIVYVLFTNPGIVLVVGGILFGIGVLCWPLIQKIL